MDEQNNNGNGAAEQELYPLDDAAIELLAQFDEQERQINTARNAMLTYFVRLHKLQGNWGVAPNRRELVKQTAAVPAAQ